MTMSFSTGRPSPKQPFRIVVLAPFSGDGGGEAASELHRVDGSNFDDLLARFGDNVLLNAPGGPTRLRFANLKSMRPEGIAGQLPGGAERLAARQVLIQLRTRRLGMEAALAAIDGLNLPQALRQQLTAALSTGRATLEAPPSATLEARPTATPQAPPTADAASVRSQPQAGEVPPPPREDVDPLGGLLSLVDVPGGPSQPADQEKSGPAHSVSGERPPEIPPHDSASAAISAAIGSIAGSGRAGKGGQGDAGAAGITAALQVLDRDLSEKVQDVMDRPEFRSFESAWRGLRFLVSRVDFREGVTVEIRDAAAHQFSDALAEMAASKAAGQLPGDPISLLIGAYTLSLDGEILQSLTVAGAAAEVIGAPFVAGVDVTSAGRIAAHPEWGAFLHEPSSEWLGLTINPFLLRLPFGSETDPVRDLDFSERPDAATWGSPALAVAVGAARSFARTGWPSLFEGRDNAIEDLPLHPGSGGQTPTAYLIGPDQASGWADAGFIPLVSALDNDRVFFVRTPSPVPGRSISYKLAERRLVNLLAGPLAKAGDPRDLERFGAAVRRELARTGIDSLDFEIEIAPDAVPAGGVLDVTIRCRPGPPVLASPREMELHFAFGA